MKRKPGRAGFTLVELTIAVTIIMVLVVIVAQCIFLSLHERARSAAHQAANELAANVLEEARGLPWDKLDQAWADGRTVPSEMAEFLPEGKVSATVEPAPASPHSRRVTVDVHWRFEQHLPLKSVRLTTLLTSRTAKKTGGNP